LFPPVDDVQADGVEV